MAEKKHIGIDYGTKFGGTTAICYDHLGKLHVSQSAKKEDADRFIKDFVVSEFIPDIVFIDAPLSLPAAFYGKGTDYFYRRGDRIVRAMSPMFIGGLTARAIKLKMELLSQLPKIKIHETYPGHLAREVLSLKDLYNKKSKAIAPFLEALEDYLPLELFEPPTNWHQVDAVLAWYSGYRHLNAKSLIVGDVEEGQILI